MKNRNVRLLVATVGTTKEPIEASLKTYSENFEGDKFCLLFAGKKQETQSIDPYGIAKRLEEEFRLYYRFKVEEISDPENLDFCLSEFRKKLGNFIQLEELDEASNVEVIFDITGGTKVMSSALTMLAAFVSADKPQYEVKIVYQGGKRRESIVEGEPKQFPSEIQKITYLRNLEESLKNKDYATASEFAQLLDSERFQPDPLERAVCLIAKAYDYLTALNFIQFRNTLDEFVKLFKEKSAEIRNLKDRSLYKFYNAFMEEKKDHFIGLPKCVESLQKISKESLPKHMNQASKEGKNLICFMLALIDYKIKKKQFADAVLFSYRVCELAVQLRLLSYEISPWSFKETVQAKGKKFFEIAEKTIGVKDPSIGELPDKIAFRESLNFLHELQKYFGKTESEVSVDFDELKKEIDRLQANRNFCFLAHGFDSKDEDEALSAYETAKKLVGYIFGLGDSLENRIRAMEL